jgi:hypothetical protein
MADKIYTGCTLVVLEKTKAESLLIYLVVTGVVGLQKRAKHSFEITYESVFESY